MSEQYEWPVLPLSAEILHLDDDMLKAVLVEIRANVRAAVEAAQPEAVGWKRVPIKPTVDMLTAMSGEWHPSRHDKARKQYAAMLEAAPNTEATSSPSDADIDYSIKAGASIHQALTMKRFQRIKKPQALTYEVTV